MTLTRAKTKALEMARVENCERGFPPPCYSAHKHTKMDPSLWSALPEHLVERVLARLPIASFFRFRSVCKSWNKLIVSPTFLQIYAEVPSQEPWFWMFTDDDYRDGSTYDPTLNKWHHLPLPSLPSDEVFFPAAAAGGLVCLGCYDDGWKRFVVCNPLTRKWRELPPMLNPPFRLYTVGMVVDKESKTFKVLVAGTCEIYEIYDSSINCWKKTCILPPGFYRWHHSILCNGFLYSRRFQFDGLVAYDIRGGVWSQIQAPMPHAFDYHVLVECQGKLYTVGGLVKNEMTRKICILELQTSRLEWVEVDCMPSMLCEEFLKDGASFSCTGYSDLVLIYVTEGLKDRMVVLYQLSTRSWRRLPYCSLPDYRMKDGLLDGISFEPRLDATV
ncbi:hypothetical protein R1flu_017595 [Riccia fluitans]|uniref:F-box domain-containing protein n=1 Tax=Riccia fluitans TaxID=41844 RepID=A0ABD1ZDL7_9MARC